MSKSIAKKILAKFLKEQKIFHNISIYFYGNRCHRNVECINDFARRADESRIDDERRRLLINMLGHTASCCEIVKPPKYDHLLKAYQLWQYYVDTHLKEIMEIYKNEQSKQ